jgi:cytoskeletal protein CcmA (bactofilin family)
LTYATNNYLQRVGTNPTSIATNTTFTGGLNASSLTTTTDSSIGGNLTVNNNLSSRTLSVTGNTTLRTLTLNTGTTSGDFTINGVLHNNNSSNGTDYISGSAVFSGGIGIAKDVYINGAAFVNSGLSIGTYTPQYISTYALDVSGVIYTNQNLIVGGNISGNLLTISGDSNIGGNLTVTKTLTTTYITSNIALTESSPLISLNGSVVVNNNTGVYKFFNMNCPINQVFSTI